MRFLEALLVVNLCVITSAHGLLYDSRPDLIERFGHPAAENRDQAFGSQECVFRFGEWEIRAFLLDGLCHMISYAKCGGAPTAVFKTERWKRLEGLPLGFGRPVSRPVPGDVSALPL